MPAGIRYPARMGGRDPARDQELIGAGSVERAAVWAGDARSHRVLCEPLTFGAIRFQDAQPRPASAGVPPTPRPTRLTQGALRERRPSRSEAHELPAA